MRLNGAAAHFDRAAADLEGFARPLWGLTPLAAGGGDFDHWELYRRGLANGTDPEHPEYWGHGQRAPTSGMVELAAIGFTMRMVPHLVWEPLTQSAKDNLAAYLKHARQLDYADNNWKFFRILVDLGLEECGVEFDRSLTDRLSRRARRLLSRRWLVSRRQRPPHRPLHSLRHALLRADLRQAGAGRRARARALLRSGRGLFADDIQHWFDEDGGTLAFGRSLTYRFACGGIWGALAFADRRGAALGRDQGPVSAPSALVGELPIADRDGVLCDRLRLSQPVHVRELQFGRLALLGAQGLPAAGAAGRPSVLDGRGDCRPSPSAEPVPLQASGHGDDAHARAMWWRCRPGSRTGRCAPAPRNTPSSSIPRAMAFRSRCDERAYNAGRLRRRAGLSDDGRHYRVRETNEVAQIAGDDTVCALEAVDRRDGRDLAAAGLSLAHPRPPDHHAAGAARDRGRLRHRACRSQRRHTGRRGRAGVPERRPMSAPFVDLAGGVAGAGVHGAAQHQPDRLPRPSCRNLRGEIAAGRHGAGRRRRWRCRRAPRPRRRCAIHRRCPTSPSSRRCLPRGRRCQRHPWCRSGSDAPRTRLRHGGGQDPLRVRRAGARRGSPQVCDIRLCEPLEEFSIAERRGPARAIPTSSSPAGAAR